MGIGVELRAVLLHFMSKYISELKTKCSPITALKSRGTNLIKETNYKSEGMKLACACSICIGRI